jgi:transposase
LEAEALFKRGWTISAIARHLGRDRKTVRAYLSGERAPGVRRRSTPEVFESFAAYVGQRLADDRHVWASTLFDEVVELGYPGSYPSFTRALRARGLRPSCPECAAGRHRESSIIDHPPGEETQFDWLELPDPPLVRDVADRASCACARSCPARSAGVEAGRTGGPRPAWPSRSRNR